MKHVIIGTAGHVDHGKTALVRALTGQETDRLREEQERGLTIEPGFAYLDFPDGTRAGIVDVPGHERFLKNMLAGSGGVDLALLTVAADEGFMPQTWEHLEILGLLGVRGGVAAVTRRDLVDRETLAARLKETEERLQGTFLAGCPVLPVSSRTGEGLEELRKALWDQVSAAPEKEGKGPFRLPVDRVFSVEGAGTVVTGTLIEGGIRVGDPVRLEPSGLEGRVRGLQVHGETVEKAEAGQRTAVNLAGIDRERIPRGQTLASPGLLQPGTLLDVLLENLPRSPRTIRNQSRVHFCCGTASVLAKTALLEGEALRPGERGFAQLRLESPLALRAGDRFVVRFYSPVETLGGGVVLDARPRRHRRGDGAALEGLGLLLRGPGAERLRLVLESFQTDLPDRKTLETRFPASERKSLAGWLEALLSSGEALEILPGRYLSLAVLERLQKRCRELLAAYQEQNPLQAGMRSAQLRQSLLPQAESAAAEALLELLRRRERLRRQADAWALEGFRVRYTRRQGRIRQQLRERCLKLGFHAEGAEALIGAFPPEEREDARAVLESLLSSGELVQLSGEIVLHREVWEQARRIAAEWLSRHEALALGTYRDLLGVSRSRALELLEAMDRRGMTRKAGQERVQGPTPLL